MCGRGNNSEFNSWVLVLEKFCSTECRDCIIVQIWHNQHVVMVSELLSEKATCMRIYLRPLTVSGLW